jgi:hypothetical protein
MSRLPTLAQLRATSQKGRHREIGSWMARRISRPTAIYGTWLAVRLGLSAHQVTLAALGASCCAAASIGTGHRLGFVAGAALLHLGFWLDHVDGQVARWGRTASLDGVYFDYLMHHTVNLALGFGLGYGLASRTGDPTWALAGLAIALGWSLLSLHNDCRYKAFFQRLKSAKGSFLVRGGSGSRPEPPSPWPRRGLGALSWPLYKLCELHVVILIVTGLAVLAVIFPPFWLASWRVVVLVMALLAPTLAAARTARLIVRGAVEGEFARWFEQLDPARVPNSGALPLSVGRPLDRQVADVVSPSDKGYRRGSLGAIAGCEAVLAAVTEHRVVQREELRS